MNVMKCFMLDGNIITEGFPIDNNQRVQFFNKLWFEVSLKVLMNVEEDLIRFAKFSKKTEYMHILSSHNSMDKALVIMKSTTRDKHYYSLMNYAECPREGLATVHAQCPYCSSNNQLNRDSGLYEHPCKGKTIVREPLQLEAAIDGIELRHSMDNMYGRGALVLEINDGSSFVVNREGEDWVVGYIKGRLTIKKAQGLRMLFSKSE